MKKEIIGFKQALSVLGLSAIALSAVPVSAAPPPAVFKDSAGNVYIHSGTGITSGARVKVDLVGSPLVRKLRAGYCGQITLSPSTSLPSLGDSVTVSGTTINLATISTTTTPPRCTGNAFEPATTTPYKLASGRIVLPGYTAGVSYEVIFDDLPSSANATVNGCSFATIRNTTNRPLPAQIRVNGTSYTLASLTTAEPPLCRRDTSSGVSTKYTPVSWE